MGDMLTLSMGTNVATCMELPSCVVRFDFHKVDYRIKTKKIGLFCFVLGSSLLIGLLFFY
jgi:hypothetical protein